MIGMNYYFPWYECDSYVKDNNNYKITSSDDKKPKPNETFLERSFGKYLARLDGDYYKIMPAILDVQIINDCVVKVTFTDGTAEKAVLDPQDNFSLDLGIAICVAKKLISDKCGGFEDCGSSIFNKIIKDGLKVKQRNDDMEREYEENQEARRIKHEKLATKRARKRAKREDAERERQIEIQTEAYYRAMKKLNAGDEEHG